ncbi:rhomboid family intramembrane serine protease [Methylacidimicrobium sp. B4]|uniref:rhomboid family intramembrane serine protease n=1 Tax=Methylacidimicrobium sp. B4 TaxID=2796139 RepID=UPI001A90B182|nr:rhomboid family intramembrane serine protease [Methylacidimicrobium sp. B4]QSR85524.1 rhomboid family intramembrane serine protease [Methylacidimicrobium sp. B4]
MGYWPGDGRGEPVFRLQNRPVYLTDIFIAFHCLSFVVGVLSVATYRLSWFQELSLSPQAVLSQGKVWQIFTYAWVHSPSLWFALWMLMFFWFGREVEFALGRRKYFFLYLSLILAPAICAVLFSLVDPSGGTFYGPDEAHMAIFVAFAALSPAAELIFGITAKWYAVVLLALYVLIDISAHAWTPLLMLSVASGIAYLSVRMPTVSWMHSWGERWRKRSRPFPTPRTSPPPKGTNAPVESIDTILDKISRNGIGSLTKSEREALERARKALLRKEQRK